MLKRIPALMIVAIGLILMVSCTHEDSCGPDVQYFPGQIGAKLLLAVSNNIDEQHLDIAIKVEGTTTMDDGKAAKIWSYSKSGVVFKHSYVVETDEAVTAYSSKDASHIDWMYSLPFEIGKDWFK